MENIFEEFISKRCEKELLENELYVETQKLMIVAYHNNDIERYSELSISLQTVAEQVVYRVAARDTCEMLIGKP